MFAIYKKEMRAYFQNPIGYVFAGIFLLLAALLCSYTVSYIELWSAFLFENLSTFFQAVIDKQLHFVYNDFGRTNRFVRKVRCLLHN